MEMSVRFPHLGISLEHVEKSITILNFEITFYGIVIAVAMLAGIGIALLAAGRSGQEPDTCLRMLLWAVILGVIGARIWYVLCSWDLYREDLAQIFRLREGGMSLYGGILGGTAGMLLYCRHRKIPAGPLADACSVGLAVSILIGWWGNFFSRDMAGTYTDSLFAMQIPAAAVSPEELTRTLQEHLTVVNGTEYVQAHPLFLYGFLWYLALALLLSWYRRKKKFPGEVYLVFLAGCGLGGIWMESLREGTALLPGTDLPVSQAAGILLFAVCAVTAGIRRTMTVRREKRKKEREAKEG